MSGATELIPFLDIAGLIFANRSKFFLRAADTLIPPWSAGGYAAVSTGPRIIPSAFVAACKIDSGNVVLKFFNAANPTSFWSSVKPRRSFLFKASRTFSTTSDISGPMPSPGSSSNFIVLSLQINKSAHYSDFKLFYTRYRTDRTKQQSLSFCPPPSFVLFPI